MLQTAFLLALVASALAVPLYNDGRIINGTEVPPGKYPSQVSLRVQGSHSCAGSILNENWILTAAHCVYFDEPSSLSVLSGTVHLDDGGTVHQVLQAIMHEEFSYYTTRNDIALVQVASPFVFDSMTNAVTLPSQDQESPGGSNATVIGWGIDHTGGSIVNELQEVNYWVLSDQECKDVHQNNQVFPTHICGYYPGGGKGQCSGDSGGPLFVNGYQAGIVSWSVKPCAVAPYPGVFTEVSAYVDWINSKIN